MNASDTPTPSTKAARLRRERPLNLLLAMRLFARVVETGSFTKAASALKVPKGTATKLVQQLEKHLHLTLLQRTTRRVLVTPGGAAYYDRVTQLLRELADIETAVGQSQTGVHGTLRVDAPTAFTQVILLPELAPFLALHPELRLILGVSDRPVDLVEEGVDCVIRCGHLLDQSLVARRVGVLESVLCASPSYIKRYGTPTSPRDLESRHVMVQYANPHTGRVAPVVCTRRRERVELTGRNVLTINEGTTYFTAGLNGLGIVLAFQFQARFHLANGDLVAVLPGWRTEQTPVYVVYPQTRHPSARLRAFVDWIASVCTPAP
jgi:LysR family transcriptional regulator for bpeEF and oprC